MSIALIIMNIVISCLSVAIGFAIAIMLYAGHSADDCMIDQVSEIYETKLKTARFICTKCGSLQEYKDTLWKEESPYSRDCYVYGTKRGTHE